MNGEIEDNWYMEDPALEPDYGMDEGESCSTEIVAALESER